MKAISLNAGTIFGLLKKTASNWFEDNALRLSAALSYYSIFSIAPLLVIAIGIAGLFSENASKALWDGQLASYIGASAATSLQSVVSETASKPGCGLWPTVIGVVTLLIGASTVFGQLKDALNTIWEVKVKGGLGIGGFIRERLLSFGMVLIIGFLLLVSLMAANLVTGFSKLIPIHPVLLIVLIFATSFAVETLLFASIFKVLPDAKVEWRNVWIGAVATAVLFEIGKWGLGLYLARQSTDSSFGAAGGVIILLLWVYYASAILFFGAEFTQVYAEATGHRIEPSDIAEPATADERAQQGMGTGKGTEENVPTPAKESVGHLAAPPLFYRRQREEPPFPRSLGEVPHYLKEKPVASMTAALIGGFTVGMISRALEKTKDEESPVEKISSGSRALAVAAVPLMTGLGRRLAAQAARNLSGKAFRHAGKWAKKKFLPIALFAVLSPTFAVESGKTERTAAAIEEATRLQVFLDKANFGPGKIDGRGGEFTSKALALDKASKGGAATAAKSGGKDEIDARGLDLSSVGEVFISYTVTKADVENVGEVPETPEAQAKLKVLSYRTAGEAIAERFHCDIDFLQELNPKVKMGALEEGDELKVPNVEPFEFESVKEPKPGSAAAELAANDAESGDETAAVKDESSVKLSVFVSTAEQMLQVRADDEVVAGFPITSGSERTVSPVGQWKVKGVAKLPTFRYDKKMLNEGDRGSDFHMLPAGPNSPVGVVWIALNKKGIGIHGTNDPDTIGRSASHGCIRLANWDVVRLAKMVKSGVPVTIE